MANTTMTYAEAINNAINALAGLEANEFNRDATIERLETLQAQLAKRSGSKGLTKTQKANEVIKSMILGILAEAEEPVNMSFLIADARLPEGTSVQKLGALLGQLVKDGKVVKGKADKHVVYSLADGTSAEGDAQ